MAIVKLPHNKPIPERLPCAICAKLITPAEATAGMLDAENKQQFACNGHFWNRSEYITGWAAFAYKQRLKTEHALDGGYSFAEEGYVRAFH